MKDLVEEIDMQMIGIEYDTRDVQGVMGAYAGTRSPYKGGLLRDLEN